MLSAGSGSGWRSARARETQRGNREHAGAVSMVRSSTGRSCQWYVDEPERHVVLDGRGGDGKGPGVP